MKIIDFYIIFYFLIEFYIILHGFQRILLQKSQFSIFQKLEFFFRSGIDPQGPRGPRAPPGPRNNQFFNDLLMFFISFL